MGQYYLFAATIMIIHRVANEFLDDMKALNMSAFVSQVFSDYGITNKINYKSYQKVLTNVFVDVLLQCYFLKLKKSTCLY